MIDSDKMPVSHIIFYLSVLLQCDWLAVSVDEYLSATKWWGKSSRGRSCRHLTNGPRWRQTWLSWYPVPWCTELETASAEELHMTTTHRCHQLCCSLIYTCVFKRIKKTTAKMFLQTNRMQATEIDLDLQSRQSREPNNSSAWIWVKSVQRFPRYPLKTGFFVRSDLDLWPWPLYSSERGTNTSSVWIWGKSVQRILRYFICKRKKSQTVPKTESYAVHCVQ